MAKRAGIKRLGILPWLFLLIIVGGAIGYEWSNHDERVPVEEKKLANYELEKTGAAAIADFSAKSKQIHRVVDGVLQENEAGILDVKQAAKTVKRAAVEGSIAWDSREVLVSMTKKQRETFVTALKKRLDKIDAVIFRTEQDTYEGRDVLRCDIGVKDTLDGDEVTIIADKVFIITKDDALIDKPKPAEKKRSAATGKGKLALVIDDFGYAQEPIEAYAKIDRPLTFAVLPNHPYSTEAAKRGHQNGQTVILHLPMEAMGADAKEEEITIHSDMNAGQIRAVVNELTEAVPYISGVNNHQGSKVTSNDRVMRAVLDSLQTKGLFFVDSRTSASSIGYPLAKELGIPTAENYLFIDNDNETAKIKRQLSAAADLAIKHGEAIAIGHARMNTAAAIKESIPELEARGVKLVPVTELLE